MNIEPYTGLPRRQDVRTYELQFRPKTEERWYRYPNNVMHTRLGAVKAYNKAVERLALEPNHPRRTALFHTAADLDLRLVEVRFTQTVLMPFFAPLDGTDDDWYAHLMQDHLVRCMSALAAAISLLNKGGPKAAPSAKMFEQMLKDYRKSLYEARDFLKGKS